jgi:hypothetical protein
MALNFQEVRQQVYELGQHAPEHQRMLSMTREDAKRLLKENADRLDELREKVDYVVQNYDQALRCALPGTESLTAQFPLPPLPEHATVLAADGSQINPDRHAEVLYGLVNVGAIEMQLGNPSTPVLSVSSELLYNEKAFDLTNATLALQRDLSERTMLAKLASKAPNPVITFTDGQMELWGGTANSDRNSKFQKNLMDYRDTLQEMSDMKVATAGYVDRPAARTVVRLLEVASLPEDQLPEIKNNQPLRGVRDIDLFIDSLQPGQRSAVFGIQSIFSSFFSGDLSLHFFYLNVGSPEKPWLARVEAPAWVVNDRHMLDALHAVLVQQSQILETRPYPYLLHRAHEVAVVSMEEKQQVTQMIIQELRRQGLTVGGLSHKQSAKNLDTRTRYGRRGST